MPNRFTPIQPGTDQSQQLAIINKNFAELDNESTKKLFYDENGIPSISIGIQQDGSSRILVAKEGVDVTQATDDQLAFNSAQNTLKVVLTGTTTITPPSPWAPGGVGKQTVTIAHDLGFKPSALVYVDNPEIVGVSDSGDGLALVPNPLFITTSYYTVIQSNAHVDETNLTITLIFLNQAGTNLSGANAYTWEYKYYLLQETAA